MTLEAWLLFCMTETVLSLNPGPSALVVLSLSMTRGSGSGLRAICGVIAANALYFAVAASGVVALHAISAEAFALIKWTGAAYLLWLGGRMIWRSTQRGPVPEAAELPPAGAGRAFWRGFVAQGSNPNLLIYFGAILPQFVSPDAPIAPQVAILALSSFAIEFTVLSLYARLSARAGQRAAPRLRIYLERIGGGLLIAAASGLARIERE